MDKYKKLAANSTILALGTFSSKFLVFLLLPLYSSVMSTEEYGIADIIAQTANLLCPVVMLGIYNSVFRFTYGNKKGEKAAFTVGMMTMLMGTVVYIFIALILLQFIPVVNDYLLILGMYIFMFGARQICAQYIRGKDQVGIYAVQGIVCTAATLLFNIFFLLVFKLGVVGYLLANIAADFTAVIYMFVRCKLGNDFDLAALNKRFLVDMFRYALPLIPATIFWWITNVSDRYMVMFMIDESSEGIYGMASKIPNLMIMLTGIFNDAWQMSVIEESNKKKIGAFFTKIFESFKAVMFTAASFLILFVKPIAKVLMQKDFYIAWKYMPFLIIACTLTGFVTFISVIYLAKKKSINSLICSAVGAGTNVILNLILIRFLGINGAAIATLVSYFIVYVVTTYISIEYVRYNPYFYRTCLYIGLLVGQAIITVIDFKYASVVSFIFFMIIMISNAKRMYMSVRKILSRGTKKNAKNKTEN